MPYSIPRNTGVQIDIVVVGTPAFRANILDGDVIIKINSEDVVDVAGFRDQLARYAGQKVELGVIRGDESKALPITLNPPSQ
ncbi:MAG: hypothetical protein DMG62_24495 [Acidobacteria bacterium]|nr:MAG: hypothetical protein DMG62_24495 [Acidobacteriota bacterium]TLZ27049.1 MAG: PDZ domain-containing protein [Gammaproteobacteria bacterium]